MRKICLIFYQSINLFVKVYIFNRIRTSQLIKELNTYLITFNFPLNKYQIKRIHFYTIQSSITNSWFCRLRGKRPSKIEIQNAIYIGAITPLLDDLVDSEKMSSSDIIDLINNSEKYSTEILVIRYLHAKIHKNCNKDFNIAFNQALISQDESLKQLQKNKLDDEKLLEISKIKGASWTLLYRSILENRITDNEKNAICTLGEILQLTNDAFDVYKDFKNGQQTIFTNAVNIITIYNYFFGLTLQMINQFKLSGYPTKNVEKATTQMMLIIARGMICIEQLLECQEKTYKRFQIEKYSRKDLICDMEKAANIFKLIKICRQF